MNLAASGESKKSTHKYRPVPTQMQVSSQMKKKFNSLYINVTTSKYIVMKIANIFLINIFMDLYYIYSKQVTFVCGSEMFMDLFYIYTYRYPFVCALKCICEKRVIYV